MAPIDAALDRYTQFSADCPAELGEAIRYSLLAPGKRLRPRLVLLAEQAIGVEAGKAMPAACAVEMVHAYSLIHDDLPAMDDDDLRRGRPTCHKVYGEALAILAGDALLARAFEILAADVEPGELAAVCCRELAAAAGASQLVGGQADDLAAATRKADFEHLVAIHRRKTGAMFTVALRIGGRIGGANDATLTALTRYGEQLGMGFQIVDDLLDVDGDEAILGKRVHKDAKLGKMTYPAIYGVDQSRQLAVDRIASAIDALAPLGPSAEPLRQLANYVITRNR